MARLWGTFIPLYLCKPVTQVILHRGAFLLLPNVRTMFLKALRLSWCFLEHNLFSDLWHISWYLSRIYCFLQSFLIAWSCLLAGAMRGLNSLYEWMIYQLIDIRPLAGNDLKAAAEKTFQLWWGLVWKCWTSICDSNHHQHTSHWHSIRLPR